MDKRTPLLVAGIIFLIMAIVQFTRYFVQFDLIVAGYVVPLSFSLVISIVLFCLSMWMFLARK